MIKFNEKKYNIIHYRKPNTVRTSKQFYLGECRLPVVNQYKYIGVILNEFIYVAGYPLSSTTRTHRKPHFLMRLITYMTIIMETCKKKKYDVMNDYIICWDKIYFLENIIKLLKII